MGQYLVFGIAEGAFLLVATLGFALVSRVHGFLNIAHAELMSIGALLTWWLAAQQGWNFVGAAGLAILVTAIAGLVIGRFVYEPMLHRGGEIMLIVSVGVVYLVHGVIEGAVRPGIKSVPLPDPATWHVGVVRINAYQVLIFVLALLCLGGLHLWLTRTRTGKSVRAIAANRELAEIRGINVRKATRLVWLVSAGLAGLAGVMLGMVGTLTTDLAFQQILLILSVSIVAGLGSIYGVAFAAFTIAIAMNLATSVVPGGYRLAVAFLAIIIVLIFRPQGLFGQRIRTA